MMKLADKKRFSWAWIVVLGVGFGCGAKIETPTNFERWNDKDAAFAIDYPAGWAASGGGKNGVKWAEFSKGSAVIKLDFDTASSIVGDIAGAASGGNVVGNVEGDEDPNRRVPVDTSHEFNKQKTELLYTNYKEKDAVKYRCGLGDARKSEFKSSSLTGEIRGYRSTALTINNGVIIICECPKEQWLRLRPAFDHVLESVGYGQ
jgi:hypothetical protein